MVQGGKSLLHKVSSDQRQCGHRHSQSALVLQLAIEQMQRSSGWSRVFKRLGIYARAEDVMHHIQNRTMMPRRSDGWIHWSVLMFIFHLLREIVPNVACYRCLKSTCFKRCAKYCLLTSNLLSVFFLPPPFWFLLMCLLAFWWSLMTAHPCHGSKFMSWA